MQWITREHVKVDRVACPWLIRKFVDPAAEFLFVPADQVMAVAEREGWTRKLERARSAYRRPSRLRNRAVLEALARQERFNVTELEKFAECSSAWFVDRFLSPRLAPSAIHRDSSREDFIHAERFHFPAAAYRRDREPASGAARHEPPGLRLWAAARG